MEGQVWPAMRVVNTISLSMIMLYGGVFTFVASQHAEIINREPVNRDHGAAMHIPATEFDAKTTAENSIHPASEPQPPGIIMTINKPQRPAQIGSLRASALSNSAPKKPALLFPAKSLKMSPVVSEPSDSDHASGSTHTNTSRGPLTRGSFETPITSNSTSSAGAGSGAAGPPTPDQAIRRADYGAASTPPTAPSMSTDANNRSQEPLEPGSQSRPIASQPESSDEAGFEPAEPPAIPSHARTSSSPPQPSASTVHSQVPPKPRVVYRKRASVPTVSGSNKVIDPSQPTTVISGVLQGLRAAGRFGTIAGVLDKFPVDGAIIRSGMTFFAPDDNSLSAFNLSTISGINILLRMHAVNQRAYTFSDLTRLKVGTRLMTESRLPIVITNNSATNFHVDNALVSYPDMYSTYGVSVHGIDAVLDAATYNSPPTDSQVIQLPRQPSAAPTSPAVAPSSPVEDTPLGPAGAAPSRRFSGSIALPFMFAAVLFVSSAVGW